MASTIRFKRIISLICFLIVLLVFGHLATSSMAAPALSESNGLVSLEKGQVLSSFAQNPISEKSTTAVDCSSTTCPSGPSGLDKCVERPKFCVYYTTDSISETEAEWAADTVQDYWDRFDALGFNEPKYSTKLKVELTDTTDCNGGTGWSSNGMSTYAGCFDVTLLAQKVLGHELTHRVQYAHDSGSSAPVQTKFLKEGTARATEDNWFTEIDHWAAALSNSSFNTEVNNYLASTNNDITSYGMRYKSCLWWKYAMEQYGTPSTEPERGIDFVREVYGQNYAGYSGISAVNRALNAVGAGTTFDNSFKQFAAANWAKDLNGVGPAYNYLDEDEAGNPGPYGPLAPTSGGTIQIGTPATWNNQNVERYGLRYYSANVAGNCPVVSASFHRDTSSPAFYHIITQNGSDLNTHVQGSGEDWSQAFLNDGITKVTAVIGSLGISSQVDLTLSCADPVLDIKQPNSVAVARVQPSTKFLAQVLVTDGSGGPVVAGLTNSDFTATVDGVAAPVTGGGFIQEQYWLLIQAPDRPDGTYELEVILEDPGTGPPLASDTSPSSVVYTADLTDQVLVIDRSGSMGVGTPTRLSAAQDAASFYVDVTRNDDGLAVVKYNHDVNPAPFNMAAVDSTVRTDAKAYINNVLDNPTGLTSIGDGLAEAVSQLASSPTENPLCSFVLLSDGMENISLFWTDVMTDVVDTGCPVTTIAFGPESDETLMQEIATETGGLYFYNDVFVSSPSPITDLTGSVTSPADMVLDLGSTYEYAEAKAEGRQRLLAEKGTVSENNPAKHAVLVDETISEVVFSLDWYEEVYADLELVLTDPGGKTYDKNDPGYTFEDKINKHVGFRIPRPEPGQWVMQVSTVELADEFVPYQVFASGESFLTLELLLPDRLGTRYHTGNRVPLYAILSTQNPIAGMIISGTVTAPNGTETIVPFHDDGEHGDGTANDGLYAGLYTAVNQAEVVYPTEDAQSEPNDEGAYRVLARVVHEKLQREALGAFSVLEGPDENQNRLPDPFEKEYGVSDPAGDPDLDKLNNYEEYMNGTDPTDPDTDDGGEKDGSEVNWGRDPLDPSDDGIAKPDFLQVRPLNGGVLLRFDNNPAYNFLRFYRGSSSAGPWEEAFTTDPGTVVFTDTKVVNDQTYFYRMEAVTLPMVLATDQDPQVITAEEITSAVLSSEAVTPSEDPLPPEARLLINGGAPVTSDLNVTLSFTPYESEGSDASETFDDITHMMLSNEPTFATAEWQPFDQDVPWLLDAERGEIAHVYARFRDQSDNESVGTEMSMILYDYWKIKLPIIVK